MIRGSSQFRVRRAIPRLGRYVQGEVYLRASETVLRGLGDVLIGRGANPIDVPAAAAVIGCVSLALVTGDPAALMRSVVAEDCSPNGSTGHVVAMISLPLADRNTPNSVRVTDQPSAYSCSVVKRSMTCPPPLDRNSTMSRLGYHSVCRGRADVTISSKYSTPAGSFSGAAAAASRAFVTTATGWAAGPRSLAGRLAFCDATTSLALAVAPVLIGPRPCVVGQLLGRSQLRQVHAPDFRLR